MKGAKLDERFTLTMRKQLFLFWIFRLSTEFKPWKVGMIRYQCL